MSKSKEKRRFLAGGWIPLLALAWLGSTAAAARATWSLVTGTAPCEGTATLEAGGSWTLQCTATTACSSGNCTVQSLPGSNTQTFCGCDSPAGTPPCCYVTMDVNAQGQPFPKVAGTCPFGSDCGWGRCNLVVQLIDGKYIVTALCIPFI